MCMANWITITAGTSGDNRKMARKLERELNRANIGSSTTVSRGGSVTLTTNTSRMQTEAQAMTMINSFITRSGLAAGQYKIGQSKSDTNADEEE